MTQTTESGDLHPLVVTFEGDIATEMRMTAAVDDLSPQELARVSLENYGFYRSLLAQGKQIVVCPSEGEQYVEIVCAFDYFEQLRFEKTAGESNADEQYILNLALEDAVWQQVIQEAELFGYDPDSYIKAAFGFERMVVRLKMAGFTAIALNKPGSRRGNIINFA